MVKTFASKNNFEKCLKLLFLSDCVHHLITTCTVFIRIINKLGKPYDQSLLYMYIYRLYKVRNEDLGKIFLV